MVSHADVVIIGGGILGASTAHFLTRNHNVKVLLVEKGRVGHGSTAHSAGHVRQHYSNEVTIRLAVRALEMFENDQEELGGPSDFVQTGYVVVAPKGQEDGLRAVIPMQQDCGVDTRLVSPEELLALFPEVSVDDIALGAWEPRSGYANPVRTVEALVRSAEARWGLMVSEDTEVVDITLDGTKVTGVVTTGGTVATDTVVNCAGPWAPQIARMVGLDYDFSLSLEYEAVFALPDGFRGVPIFSDAINLSYFRPAGPGRILVGEGYPKEQEPVANPDVYQDGPDTRTVRRLAERLAARVPALAPSLLSDELVGSYLEGYSGVYDITPDWNPIVGGVAGVTGYYAAAGGSGHCFKIGPPIGEALADVIVGGRPAIDVASLGHARFSERELLGSVWGPGNRA